MGSISSISCREINKQDEPGTTYTHVGVRNMSSKIVIIETGYNKSSYLPPGASNTYNNVRILTPNFSLIKLERNDSNINKFGDGIIGDGMKILYVKYEDKEECKLLIFEVHDDPQELGG